MFDRPRHNAILKALRSFDTELFSDAGCYFGGGTSIVLSLGEYRESIDIDFLCATQTGYRTLREAIWGKGLSGLLRAGADLEAIRDMRTDQYGIRTFLRVDGYPIKFEVVREARIDLAGEVRPDFGIPVLARPDMYAEKLLANADRWRDTSVLSRDVIDLSMMISRWGPVPAAAWDKVRNAYGTTVDQAYQGAVEMIRNPDWLRKCMKEMSMREEYFREILRPHGGALTKQDEGTDC